MVVDEVWKKVGSEVIKNEFTFSRLVHELHQSDKLLFKVKVTKHSTIGHPKQTVQFQQNKIINLHAAHMSSGKKA